MVEILELLDREFKTTVINMLSTLTVKADNTPKQMGNISREMEILRNNLFKKTDRKLTEMINAFHGLIS